MGDEGGDGPRRRGRRGNLTTADVSLLESRFTEAEEDPTVARSSGSSGDAARDKLGVHSKVGKVFHRAGTKTNMKFSKLMHKKEGKKDREERDSGENSRDASIEMHGRPSREIDPKASAIRRPLPRIGGRPSANVIGERRRDSDPNFHFGDRAEKKGEENMPSQLSKLSVDQDYEDFVEDATKPRIIVSEERRESPLQPSTARASSVSPKRNGQRRQGNGIERADDFSLEVRLTKKSLGRERSLSANPTRGRDPNQCDQSSSHLLYEAAVDGGVESAGASRGDSRIESPVSSASAQYDGKLISLEKSIQKLSTLCVPDEVGTKSNVVVEELREYFEEIRFQVEADAEEAVSIHMEEAGRKLEAAVRPLVIYEQKLQETVALQKQVCEEMEGIVECMQLLQEEQRKAVSLMAVAFVLLKSLLTFFLSLFHPLLSVLSPTKEEEKRKKDL